MSILEANIPAEIQSLSPYAPTRSTIAATPLSADELRSVETYWRACNYLSLGMIYLQENPLLTEALRPDHIKNRLLGHWGSSPGLSFIYVHLTRLIRKYELDMIFIAGPGHGAPGVLGPAYLEGTYSRSIRRKVWMPMGCASSSNSSRFPAESTATALLRRPDRFTKAESSATRSPMRVAQRSTILN